MIEFHRLESLSYTPTSLSTVIGLNDPLFFKHILDVSLPTLRSKTAIFSMRDRAFCPFIEADFQPLFHRLYFLSAIDSDDQYERVSDNWRRMGFFHEDPGRDIQFFDLIPDDTLQPTVSSLEMRKLKGMWTGGSIVVEGCIFFLEKYNDIAVNLISQRVMRSEIYSADHSYPFAKTCMRLMRHICILYEIVNPVKLTVMDVSTNSPVQYYHDRKPLGRSSNSFSWRSYWKLISEDRALYRMLAIAILLFDEIFEISGATFAQYDSVWIQATRKFEDGLIRATNLAELEAVVDNIVQRRRSSEHLVAHQEVESAQIDVDQKEIHENVLKAES